MKPLLAADVGELSEVFYNYHSNFFGSQHYFFLVEEIVSVILIFTKDLSDHSY